MQTIDVPKQARDCLTEEHVTCSRYRPVMAVSPVVARRSPGPRRGFRRIVRLAAVVLLILAAIPAGVMIGSWIGASLGDDPGPSSAPAPGSAAPSIIVEVSANPTEAASATASAATTAPATPAATSTGLTRHLVEPGETLSAIALRYGVTVAALVLENRIGDPNLIVVGQRLAIPPR